MRRIGIGASAHARAPRSVISVDSLLGLPLRVYPTDDSLLAVISATEPFVHLVRVRDGRILRSFGRRGRADNEFVAVRGITVSDGPTLWLYEAGRRRMAERRIDGFAVENFLALPDVRMLEPPVWLDHRRLLSHAATDSSSVLTFDTKTGKALYLGDPVRFARSDSVPLAVQARAAADVRICYERSRGQFIRAFRFAGRIDIVDTNGTIRADAMVPERFEPSFSAADGTVGFTVGMVGHRVGYIGCAVTARHIFALYSGRTVATEETAPAGMGRFVHVFTWDGAFVRAYELEHDSFGIAYDPYRQVILAVEALPNPAVVSYKILEDMRP